MLSPLSLSCLVYQFTAALMLLLKMDSRKCVYVYVWFQCVYTFLFVFLFSCCLLPCPYIILPRPKNINIRVTKQNFFVFLSINYFSDTLALDIPGVACEAVNYDLLLSTEENVLLVFCLSMGSRKSEKK